MEDIDMEDYRYLGHLEGRLDSIRILCRTVESSCFSGDMTKGILKTISIIADLPLRVQELRKLNKD